MPDEYVVAPVASPAAPSETDYAAICAAVTETERGRWFLGEYARRNRHADTELVLAAIARLEVALDASRAAGQQTALRGDVADMLKAIAAPPTVASSVADSGTIDKTATELDAMTAATERATSDILAAAERIQEIAWTMREQGTDDRACDELDGLATTIYTACSFQDLTGQQADRVIEHLRHPDEAEDKAPRLDQAGIDRVMPPPPHIPAEAKADHSPAPVVAIAAPNDVPAATEPEAAAPAEPAADAEPVKAELVAAEPAETNTVEAELAEAEPADAETHDAVRGGVDTDALLADLLAMIRQAKQPVPLTAQAVDADWNKPLAPMTLDDDVAWVDQPPAKPVKLVEPTATELAEVTTTAPHDLDDDLLLPIPASWEASNEAAPAPVASQIPAGPPPSPLVAVVDAALSGDLASAPQSAVAAGTKDAADPSLRPPVSSQALAAVAALASLSDAEKIALFS